MPPPTELQFDGRLSNVSVQYENAEYIADMVLPAVPAPKKEGVYKKYGVDEVYRVPDTKVGHSGEPNELVWETSEATFACKDQGLKAYVSNEEIDNADAPIRPMVKAVDRVMDQMSLAKEVRTADAVFDANNYAAGNQIDIQGGWATLTDDILTDLEVGIDACLMKPNILVMGLATWRKVARNEKILAAVKGTLMPQQIKAGAGGTATPVIKFDELAGFLGLEAVWVGDAKKDITKKGQTAVRSAIWDGVNVGKGGAALLRVKANSFDDVVSMSNFTWKTRQVFRNPTTRGAYGGQEVRVVETNGIHIVATDVGYLFKDCLVT